MSSRVLVLGLTLALVVSSLWLAACGDSGTTTVTTADSAAETSAESSATERRIEEVERETKEAELEAAEARRQAAKAAARAKRRAAKTEEEDAAAEKAQAAEGRPEQVGSEPPDVIGMRLPEAESTLRAAGFRTQAENTDTTFGIVIRSHYTICTESEPHGDVVTILAQKYGC